MLLQALEDRKGGQVTKPASAKDLYAAVNAQAEAARVLLGRIQGLWDRAGQPARLPHIPAERLRGLEYSTPGSQSTGSKRGALLSPEPVESSWWGAHPRTILPLGILVDAGHMPYSRPCTNKDDQDIWVMVIFV